MGIAQQLNEIQKRSARQATMNARSGPHEVVDSPRGNVASDGLSVYPANASSVPRGVVVAPPATTTLAKPSSSLCVAGVTTLPAMRPYPTTAVAKRPFVVPPIAPDGIIAHRAIPAANEPPYKSIKLQYSLGSQSQALPPDFAAATAAIATAAACPEGTEAHRAATARAIVAIIAAARENHSLA